MLINYGTGQIIEMIFGDVDRSNLFSLFDILNVDNAYKLHVNEYDL